MSPVKKHKGAKGRALPAAKKRIRSLRPGEQPPEGVEPRRFKNSAGYVRLRWKVGKGEYVETFEHRWLMDAQPGQQVHHKNRIKDDNRLENLELVDPSEHAAKHTVYDPQQIVDLYKRGYSTPDIALVMGCDPSVAYRALVKAGVKPRSSSEGLRLYHRQLREDRAS